MKNRKGLTARSALVIVSAAVLLITCVGMTVAFIIDRTNTITNTFVPSKVSCSVQEINWEDGNTVKTDVSVQNTGDTGAYIRAAIVINWQNSNGDVYGTAPVENIDYTISLNNTGWTLGSDGFYYHKVAVDPGKFTEKLIENCTVTAAAPADGYTLSVEILASAVQSTPDTAVNQAWGATVTDGTLSPAS